MSLLLLLYGIETEESDATPPTPPGAPNTLRVADSVGGGGQLRHGPILIYPNVHQWARRDEEELELMR